MEGVKVKIKGDYVSGYIRCYGLIRSVVIETFTSSKIDDKR